MDCTFYDHGFDNLFKTFHYVRCQRCLTKINWAGRARFFGDRNDS